MPRFSQEQVLGTQHKGGKIFVLLGGLEALSILPLAFFLPSSRTALALAVGLVAALNTSMFTTVASKMWMVVLEVLNLVASGIFVWLIRGNQHPPLPAFGLMVVFFCGGLLVLGIIQLPKGLMRKCLAAQQGALASTLICWMLVQQLRMHLGLAQAAPLPDAMAFRFLFLGPLGFTVVVFISGFTGWTSYMIFWTAICVGQFAIGFLDLSVYLDIAALNVIAFGLLASFVILLGVALIPRRFLHLPSSWRSQ
jgi:hypothetical protein